ncbi:MAG TPA: hypothetical protein VFO94_11320 [Gammaproteobacteria bacterium]|nr:hypothetical protein [Gammaproteobacteria bacterium]
MSARAAVRSAALAAWLALGAACGRDEPEAEAVSAAAEGAASALTVELDSKEQRKLGIETAELAAGAYQATIDGPARVVDAREVVDSMAALAEAEAHVRTSRTALERARKLFALDTAVSADTLEAAERQAAQDESALRSARARATLGFGPSAPWLDAGRREPLLAALTAGSTLLLSASFPSGLDGGAPASLTLRRVDSRGSERWTAAEVWLGPADPSVPGPTALALLPAQGGLGAGERLIASVAAGESAEGVVLPRSAVVLSSGEAWAYVQAADEEFVRRRVDVTRALADGYFQAAGFELREHVVVAGAGLLLAREIGGGAEAAD